MLSNGRSASLATVARASYQDASAKFHMFMRSNFEQLPIWLVEIRVKENEKSIQYAGSQVSFVA